MGDGKRKRKHSSESSTSDSDSDSSSSSSACEVPVSEKKTRKIGPQIPANVTLPEAEPAQSFIGPMVPQSLKEKLPGYRSGSDDDDDDDDDCIGPMPFTGDPEAQGQTAAEEFELRAQKMKRKMMGEDEGPEVSGRESWMTELPPEISKNFGLGPRQFRKNSGAPSGGDRSCWTDTPADRERKAKEAAEGKGPKQSSLASIIPTQRDIKFAEQVAEHNKSKRGESLLEMHRKKLEKEKKKAEKKAKKKEKKEKKKSKKKEKDKKEKEKKKEKKAPKPERRPFDRDLDLQVNRLDDARRKALIKKSAELGSRFGKGAQKFL